MRGSLVNSGVFKVLSKPAHLARERVCCPFCRDTLSSGTATCTDCATRYHSECALELPSCAVLGCEGALRASQDSIGTPAISIGSPASSSRSPANFSGLGIGLLLGGVVLGLIPFWDVFVGFFRSGDVGILACLACVSMGLFGCFVRESSDEEPHTR